MARYFFFFPLSEKTFYKFMTPILLSKEIFEKMMFFSLNNKGLYF